MFGGVSGGFRTLIRCRIWFPHFSISQAALITYPPDSADVLSFVAAAPVRDSAILPSEEMVIGHVTAALYRSGKRAGKREKPGVNRKSRLFAA